MIEPLVCKWDELPDEFKGFESQIPPKDAKPCGGNIIVTVPYFGGTSSTLEITYKCDKCGCTWYPELPTEYNLSKFLTKAFAEMPQKKLAELRKELKEEAEKRAKQLEKFRTQGEKYRRKNKKWK
jgi:Zn-finger nucleic acid-binding protein